MTVIPLPDAPLPSVPGQPECWPITIPPADRPMWADLTDEVRNLVTDMAVSTLRGLTAGTVGGCAVTVWPVRVGHQNARTWITYPLSGGLSFGGSEMPGGGAYWPVLAAGSWWNLGCADGCGQGACTPGSEVRLPGTIIGGIESVVELGEVLDPSAYRLVRRDVLRKVDGTAWACGPGDLAVTYYPNPHPGAMGALAAGALAVEYAKGMTGQPCRLPDRATNVVRNGVQVQLATPADLFPQGITGIREADLFIRRVNPNRLATAPVVWSPDL